jgi:anti-sigma B factor antagonist
MPTSESSLASVVFDGGFGGEVTCSACLHEGRRCRSAFLDGGGRETSPSATHSRTKDNGMAFDAQLQMTEGRANVTLTGSLDAASAPQFKEVIERAAAQSPRQIILFMEKLDFLASAGLQVLIFAKQKMGSKADIYLIGSQGPVLGTLEMTGFHHSVYIQDSFAEAD